MPPALSFLMRIIACTCKRDCNARCSCRKAGERCSDMCGHCRGTNCLNAASYELNTDELSGKLVDAQYSRMHRIASTDGRYFIAFGSSASGGLQGRKWRLRRGEQEGGVVREISPPGGQARVTGMGRGPQDNSRRHTGPPPRRYLWPRRALGCRALSMRVTEVSMERRRSEGAGKREIPEKTRRQTA
ncbi:hypothetical protein PR048_002404 [Dryococelus australis]|uniref:AWS domain-containing protein n=1 Tax=Dryococelus australis TaxID=614101 RepID=A0ABQ9IK33_9NEOP|nr:hypothetical protein PR048_002404 [Dryococelus australis]